MTQHKKTVIGLLLASLLGLSLVTSSKVEAQIPEVNLGISPPLTHVIVRPGKSALTTVTIENESRREMSVIPRLVDIESDNQSGVPILLETLSFPYIALNDQQVEINRAFPLAVGEKKQLLFTISIPPDVNDQEYHFAVVFEAKPNTGEQLGESTETSFAAQLASNFIVTVTDTGKDRGQVELDSISAPFFIDSFWPITVEASLKNVGINTTVPEGTFRVKNWLNQVVQESRIYPMNVLPNSSRKLFLSEQVAQGNELFEIPVEIKYDWVFLLGLYTIELEYQASNQPLQTYSQKVIAAPFLLVITIAIGLVILLIARYFLTPQTH